MYEEIMTNDDNLESNLPTSSLLKKTSGLHQWRIQDFLLGGAPTSDVGTFWQKYMQKRKNWILLGGTRQRRPLDPTMYMVVQVELFIAQ